MSDPDIDPYAILGVSKEATLPDIKSAHRKLVLKCHPDKIQDQSLRVKAQDEFQKVQQAYELLSDDARRLKYDQKVRLMELRREMLARGGSAAAAARGGSATSREFRNGHFYEERTPGESFFFEDEVRFTEEPQSTGRKHDEYGRRHRTARPPPEERRRSKPTPAARVPRETTARDTTRAHHENRDKHRTKERRREAFAKTHERSAPYVDSDGGGDSDDSSVSFVYVRLSRPSSDRRKAKSKSQTSRRSEPRYSREDVDVDVDEDDDDVDSEARAESKHDKLHNTAKNYIRRTKSSPPIEIEPAAPRRHRHHRSSRSPPHSRRDESTPDADASTRRTREPTPKRPSRESVRHQGSSRSRHGSYEHLETRAARSYETVPPIPTTTPASAPTRPPPTRAATMNTTTMPSTSSSSHHRVKREGSARAADLAHMAYEHPPSGHRPAAKFRMERYDSGYSSPGTPDMGPGESSPPKPTRYKIVDDPELVEPSPPPSSSRSGGRTAKPIRSNSYIYPAETSAPVSPPPLQSSSSSSSKPLYNEIPKYTVREINPDAAHAPHVVYSKRDGPRQYYEDYRHQQSSMGRRQSAYA